VLFSGDLDVGALSVAPIFLNWVAVIARLGMSHNAFGAALTIIVTPTLRRAACDVDEAQVRKRTPPPRHGHKRLLVELLKDLLCGANVTFPPFPWC
jgi:hypothetical protein